MRFLIAGLGSAGQRHVRNLRRLVDGAEFIAWRVRGLNLIIDDRQQAHAGPLEQAYNLRVVRDLADGLAQGPDAVIVTNPIAMHCETALAAVNAGCAVFVEKPLSDRWDGVEELLDVSRRRRLVTMVGYQGRFHPALRRVKALLDEARIGAPTAARLHFGEYLPGAHPYEDYREAHMSRRVQGGGVILCLSHELDIVQWLFGPPASLYACGGHLSALDLDVEDTALIVLECHWSGRTLPVSVSLDFVQRPPQRYGEIVCQGGTIRWDLLEPSVSWFDAAGGSWQVERFPDFQRNQQFLDEMAQFLRALQGIDVPDVPLESGARTLQVVLAAKCSLQTGLPVAVDSGIAALRG